MRDAWTLHPTARAILVLAIGLFLTVLFVVVMSP